MGRGKVLTTKLLSQGYQKTKLVATLKKFYGRHHDLDNPYNVAVSRIVTDVFASDAPQVDFPNPGYTLLPIFPLFRPMGMVGEACLPSNAYSVLFLLFVALWFILRGDLLYVFPCVILFLCFSVLLALRLPRSGKRELILVLFVRLFGLCLFRFVGFLFLLGSGKGCGL